MKLIEPGTVLDCFVIEECLHAGGMAHIYSVRCEPSGPQQAPAFSLVMKVPRMAQGDGAENILSFEVEQQLMPVLRGNHVPRYVASGDLTQIPYIVMEHVTGQTLQHEMDTRSPWLPAEIARRGAALARAAHSLHMQEVCHLDIKPANILVRPDDTVVLLDFGLSCHALYPDLLAEEMRKAVGSPIWIAPEQVVGVRGDPRSDIFSIGVVLYQLATGELPFGEPQTQGGLRQRLWMDPVPPRKHRPDLAPWLQEIILRCLEPEAARRYPSAAQLAFDLANPDQVQLTARAEKTQATGFRVHFKRWIKAAGMHYRPSELPTQRIGDAPILMVAVPHQATEATLQALNQAASRSLGLRPGARLACVTVVSSSDTGTHSDESSETTVHRQRLASLRQWASTLDLHGHPTSFHALESGDVAQALLGYAEGNDVSMIIMGAATHGLQMQRWIATVPIKVAMQAPCTVMLVKPAGQ